MTDRPTVTVHREEFDVASDYKAELPDDVTWGDILVAGAKTLAGEGEPQAEPQGLPEDVLTEDHLEDIRNVTESAVESALENLGTRA